MARECLFCEGRPVNLEHVWPEWTSDAWASAPSYTHEYRSGDEVVREWPAVGPDVTVKAVDEGCNSGWMSDLESNAKALLVPLARGESTVVGAGDQKLLALWALKTALMFKSLEMASPTFNRDYYKSVYSHLPDPPAQGSYVWLGRFRPDVSSGQYRTRDLFPETSEVAGPAHGFLAGFSLGQVVFQVGMWAVPNRGFEVDSDFLVRLWPYAAEIEWPLERAFGLDAFPGLTDGHFPEAASEDPHAS